MATLPAQPPLDAPAADWLVYADALQQAGDPRGELIALNEAVARNQASAEQRDAFVEKHAEALLGPAAVHRGSYSLSWRWCAIDEARVVVRTPGPTVPLVEALLESPAARGMRTLTLAGDPPPEGEAVIFRDATDWLAERGLPPSCTGLSFVDERAARTRTLVSRDFRPEPNMVAFGEIPSVVAAAPHLERLSIVTADASQLTLAGLRGSRLRAFRLDCLRYGDLDNHPSAMVRALAAASWPSLTDFAMRLPEIWISDRPDDTGAYLPVYDEEDDDHDDHEEEYDDEGYNQGVDWRIELQVLLPHLKACPLERLALTSFDSAATFFTALLEDGLPPTLQELDLSDSSISASNVEWMLANRELFAGLRRLVLERTLLRPEDAARLREIGPEIVHSQGTGATWRYLVGME